MGGTVSGFSGMEIFFIICALVGGFFVVVRLVMQFFGGDTDTDFDHDLGMDGHHADSDVGFKLLSLHGLTSFLMMFGMVGLALYHQSGAGLFFSLVGAILAGLATVWVIGRLFLMAGRLQSSGTLPATVGVLASTGTVYSTIPKGGTGVVTINARNRLREFSAVELNGEELPTGTPIQVIAANGKILVVKSIATTP